MAHLNVYLNKIRVGELLQDERGRLAFSYREAFLKSSEAAPLSRHLPLHPRVFSDEATRAFFANLLPEGDVLEQTARRLGIPKENTFALLERMGGDCAGAVSVLLPGQAPASQGAYRRISHEELGALLKGLPAHPFLADEEGVRLSLAGAQNKLPVFYSGAGFHIPERGAPSSHILKTAIQGLEDTIGNEAFCMMLAQAVGLSVPSVDIVDLGGMPVYRIERYDRHRLPGGELIRIHQEDFCQALGVVPALKYEAHGGPGFQGVFDLVREWSTEPLPDMDALLGWAMFNFLIGNADAHGKNLSFVYDQGAVRLAPFYDLLSTAAYEGQVNNKFAMRMGKQKDPRYLSASDLAGFAQQAGIGKRAVFAELKGLIDRIEKGAKVLLDSFVEKGRHRIIALRIAHVITGRIDKVRHLLQGAK
jgi:serine/threonine-protein kinase HipA